MQHPFPAWIFRSAPTGQPHCHAKTSSWHNDHRTSS